MVKPKYSVANRSDRRPFQREAKKALGRLIAIEQEFLNLLFDEAFEYSYRALFHVYKERYDAEVKRLEAKQFNFFTIETDYFTNTYKPLEQRWTQTTT